MKENKFKFLTEYNSKDGGSYDEFLLVESNIERINKWVNGKEKAGITGYRNEIKNVREDSGNAWDLENVGKILTTQEKKARNRELKASLLGLKYGVTAIRGKFWENYGTSSEVETNEDSFFVVNLNDDPNFYNNLFRLGAYYNQDSILWKPKDNLDGYQVGTNDAPWPGYGNKEKTGVYIPNVEAEFMSRIGNKGFAFTDKENTRPDSEPTFDNRKNLRREKQYNQKIGESIINSFDLFWDFNNSTKHLIMNECRPVLKVLSLENNGVEINNNNFKNIIY